MESIYKEITALLSDAAVGLGLPTDAIALEHPTDRSHGDLSTNIALVLAKQTNRNPVELAAHLADAIRSIASPSIAEVTVAGPGFINFTLSDAFFGHSVQKIINDDEVYGTNTARAGATILVEYTDPNTFKEFHIGHLMSNAIGESFARLMEASGAKVSRLCYQSDVGLNIAKAIWGMMQNVAMVPIADAPLSERIQFVSNAYVFGSRQYEDDPEAKAEIDAYNKKIYDLSDSHLNELYKKGRAWSVEHFQQIFTLLGTNFDHLFYERDMAEPALAIVRDGLAKGIFEESEGAVIYRGENKGLHTRVFINKFGLPTYEAKDLALASTKTKLFPDAEQSIVITGNEQNQYFKVVLEAMKELDSASAEKTKHVSHGMMRFAEGKMSSRKGNVISGESLIEDMRVRVIEKMSGRQMDGAEKEKASIAIAVAAIKYAILKQSPGKDIIFDPESSLSFEGDSGPYLQYSLARAYSLLRKAAETNVSWQGTETLTLSDVHRLLYRFPMVTERAAKDLAPQILVTYLTELAGVFNSFYANTPVLSAPETAAGYLALTEAFSIVMRNGLKSLGLTPLEQM